ncbi:TonB-dependent receptor, partial [Candidatus Aminicenantes bacterium AC-335-A11]|nr:TonB-dependent receptor [Candidatus Aminicenantes bacterium AC-335-A11]
ISPMVAVTSEGGHFRFLSLPPADDYTLTFELQGFKKVVRENISVRVGVNVDLNIVMEMGKIEEEVIVVAQTPIVDTKKATVQANVTRDALQTLPTARDPWVILELAPGVMVDRENVGGSESGQQSNFLGRGDSGDNAQWNIDGVNISDPAAVGASPMYYDYDMFEEMNIQTAANDVSAMTGGIIINFVTPRGGNKFAGGARFYWTDKKFQSENVPSELKELQLVGNKVHSIYDYGLNIGGPIIKDKLWFWGSWGVQDINQITITGDRDDTDLKNYNFKLNAQLGNHRLEFYFNHNDKKKYGRRRTGGYLDSIEATWDQSGPGFIFKIQDEITFGQNFFLSLKGSRLPMGFKLEPKAGRDKIVYWDVGINKRWNTGLWYETNRPMWYGEVFANYFAEDFLGANHEFKFGVEYKNAVIDSSTGYGNGGLALLYNGYPYQFRFYNWWGQKYYANRISAYFQDIIEIGRLTINAGIRYDRQWGGILEYTQESPTVDMMKNIGGVDYNWPATTQSPYDYPFTWNFFSPRVGFIYDIFGNGKTLLKGNFSIYGSQFDASAAWTMWYIYGQHRFRWTDLNNDLQVQANELTYLFTIDLTDLAEQTSEIGDTYYDPNLSPEKTMEILIGIEHELSPDFGIGVNFQYRKLYDYNWSKMLVYDYLQGSILRQVQNDDWVQAGQIFGNVYWDLDYNKVGYSWTDYLTKRPDYYQKYWAIEFIFKKRLTKKWMLDGSFTYQDHRVYYPTRDSYQDPTDHLPVDKLHGQPMAYQAAGSGASNVFMNSRWLFKLAALYQLPYGFNISGTLSARDGFISPTYAEDTTYYKYNWEFASVWTEKFGSTRDPAVILINLRLEKRFKLGDFGNVYLSADCFNVTNSSVRLARHRNMTAANYNQTLAIMSPRIFRFGIRFEF